MEAGWEEQFGGGMKIFAVLVALSVVFKIGLETWILSVPSKW